MKIRFIESVFGRAALLCKKNINVKCPKCGKSKLSIRLEDDVNHCWVCGLSGATLLPILKKFGSKEQVFEYTTVFLPENPKFNRIKTTLEDEQETQKLQLPSDFKLLALEEDEKNHYIQYVTKRNLTRKDLWFWKLGVSNEQKLFRRVIVPSFDCNGDLNYYVARDTSDSNFMKYVNCDVNKNDIIFNEININWSQRLTLVEGTFDLMKCKGNATCLLGSSISEKSLLFNKILEHNTPIVLLLDSDMKSKVQVIAKKLHEYDIETYVADLGKRKDPGEMTTNEVSDVIANCKQWEWQSYLRQKIYAVNNCHMKL